MNSAIPARASAAALLTALLVAPLLPGAADATAGGTLYRWSEPDGALTYSPSPPADGTPYDTVDAMTLRPADGSDAAAPSFDSERRPASVPPETPGRAAASPSATPAARALPVTTANSRAAGTDDGVDPFASDAYPPLGAASIAPTGAYPRHPDGLSGDGRTESRTAMVDGDLASREKERRCGELEKRVISLERRLATPLTPEAMDDTVVRMARYQESVDRHCR